MDDQFLDQGRITIRRPVEGDQRELDAFFRLVLEDAFQANGITDEADIELEAEILEKERSLSQDLVSGGKERLFLVAEAEGKIVGTVASGPPGPMMLKLTDRAVKDLPELSTVFTHPRFRNQGIATRLFHAMLVRLDGEGVEEACFDSGYPIAQKIWQGIFGRPDHIIRDHWGKDSHHMIWRIRIQEVLPLLEERLANLERGQ